MKRRGVFDQGPVLSSDDPNLQGKSAAEIRAVIEQHMRKHGIAGLDDLLEKAERLATPIAQVIDDNPLATSAARDLLRGVHFVRRAIDDGVDRSVLHKAINLGLAFATLTINAQYGKKVDGRFRSDEQLAEHRFVGKRKKSDAEILKVAASNKTIVEKAKALKVSVSTMKRYEKWASSVQS